MLFLLTLFLIENRDGRYFLGQAGVHVRVRFLVFFFKQKTAYEMFAGLGGARLGDAEFGGELLDRGGLRTQITLGLGQPGLVIV